MTGQPVMTGRTERRLEELWLLLVAIQFRVGEATASAVGSQPEAVWELVLSWLLSPTIQEGIGVSRAMYRVPSG